MSKQDQHGKEGRPAGALCAAIMAVIFGGWAHAQGPAVVARPGPDRAGADPYYIVLCTDVSGSMNESDPLYRDRNGKQTTLRDDAQLTFLTLLGECPIESFVGACKFSDRVTGGLPGGILETAAIDNALLTWRSVGSDWESLREQLSTRKSDAGGTRMEAALSWAHRRISLARQKDGTTGHGVIILLSDGDPDRAPGELRGGAVLDKARSLAMEDIRLYSIIVNKASYRSGRTPGRLSDRDLAAELLMEQMGSLTRGGTYRITATSGLLQIFLDIFRIMPTSPPILNATAFDVSRHHRTVVFIGPMSPSITIEPAAGRAGAQPYSLAVKDGLDETSGIDRRVIPLTLWNIIILRRPPDSERLNRYWSGTWRPTMEASQTRYEGRVYLITDFLLRLAVEPTSPCWTNERIRIAAHLVERPRELGEQIAAAPPLQGENLSLSFLVNRGQTTTPLTIEADRSGSSPQVHRSVPFQLEAPGQYTVACECLDRADKRTISLGTFTVELPVEPAPLSLILRKASNEDIIFPKSGGGVSVGGGEEIYAELRGRDDAAVPSKDARLLLMNATPAQQPFTTQSPGRLTTGRFALPKGDVRLRAQAQIQLTTANVARQLNLPGDFLYDRGDLELTCQFADSREALWVGEYHRQLLQVSVFPVFADAADTVAGLFPRELPQAVMTFLDTADGQPSVVPVRCVLGSVTRDRQQNALRLTAAYTLELATPIPTCRRCEIDPGLVLSGLNAGKKQYDVVDSAQTGILTCRIRQSGDDAGVGGVPETLVANEPIMFSVQRGLNRGIRDVAFELREQGAAADVNAVRVAVPLLGIETNAQTERSLRQELRRDANYDVYVHATFRPEGADRDMKLRLRGGSFRAVERYLELQQLVVGSPTGEDLSCHAMETIQIPLQASFTGYRPGNPDHSRLIAEFKDSCRLIGTNDAERQSDVSTSIQWMKAEPVVANGSIQSYRLEGYGRYRPDAVGRHRMELSGDIEVAGPGGKLQSVCTANCRLVAQEPRFKVKVHEITPRAEKLLFDSERLAASGKPIEPARNSYATQLRVSLDFSDAVLAADGQTLKAAVAVKHRSPSETYTENVFSQELELTRGNEKIQFVVDQPPLERTGDYFLQLQATGGGSPPVEFATPALVSIVAMNEPQELMAPRGFLTGMVRQWPFSYQVPIPSSWSFKPIDLRFEFQFAGMKDSWLEGVAFPGEDGRQLIVRGPDYLPACAGVEVGPMKFRLRYMGADRVTWESVSPIQVVKPCLEGVDLLWRRGPSEYISEEPNLALKPPFALRVRPRFRSAAELQGWWSKQDTKIWIARGVGGAAGGFCTTPEYLGRLTQLAGVGQGEDRGQVRMFQARSIEEEQNGIEVLAETGRRGRFWGLPRFSRSDVYHVLASASYEEKPLQMDAAAGASSPNRVITEWTPSRAVTVERPWDIPYMWWFLVGVTGVCLSAQATRRRLVPTPARLGLSIHIRGDATIRPARQNPTVADLEHETSWSDEMQMYTEYLSSRHPGWSRLMMRLATWPTLTASRLFRTRRRLWITVRPEVDASATNVQTARMCVWTGVGNREGALWSSQGGLMDLPSAGETAELGLNLTYQVGGNEMSAPVTVCIRRA